jgi:preprotein translocase subunit SecG
MKKAIILFLLILLNFVFATTINAPKEIPANINWSFSVELEPSNSFTETQVYIDDLLVVTAYNDKQPVTEDDFVLKAFVLDKEPQNNAGLILYVSYFGIKEGTHKIKTKTLNQGNVIQENEFEIKAVDTVQALTELPKTFSEDIEILMKGIIKKINEQKNKLEELQNSNEKNLQEKIKSIKEEINALQNSLNELKKIKETREKNLVQEENKLMQRKESSELNQEINSKNKTKNFVTGFYNFSVKHAWYGVVFLIVLLVLLALFQLYKIKSEGSIFEEALEEELQKKEKSLNESKERKKGFSLGDLIQKKD